MECTHHWVGRGLASGRYEILAQLGVGSMGQVYRAHDRQLNTDVVIKCPVIEDTGQFGSSYLERFDLEVRALVKLGHPHIVQILNVGTEEGCPYVVMQYLSGGSLRDRMDRAPGGEPGPLPPETLRGWLMDVAEALDFIHRQNYLHRDVKPENILFDRAGNAYLADFGIIKILAAEGRDLRSSAMTAPGFLVGTPNYVAPEVVMGGAVVAASDQYSLAMTVYEVLLGKNPMEGPTPAATLVNQRKVVPPALIDVIPGMPRTLSDAVRRGLSKGPGERFDCCITLAHEVLAEIPAAPDARSVARSFLGMVSQGAVGQVSCPICNSLLGVGRELAGQGIRCKCCQATLRVAFYKPRTITLNVVGQPTASWSRLAPEHDQTTSSRTGLNRVPARGTGRTSVALPVPGPDPLASNDGGSRRKSAIRRGIANGLAGLRWKPAIREGIANGLARLRWKPAIRQRIAYGRAGLRWKPAIRSRRGIAYGLAGLVLVAGALFLAFHALAGGPVVLNIAYGTEKKKWLESALAEFRQTPEGRRMQVNLVGMGSIEGAQAILDGPGPVPFHAWLPASSAYRGVFESEWRFTHHGGPILSAESLVLSPMVFVMWKPRHDAFLRKYAKLDFRTLAKAMQEPGGWGEIAGRPDWGRFKFGHTDPNRFNSGLQMLVLMAYELSGKRGGLDNEDITRAKLQEWLTAFERAATRHDSVLTHSTGALMEEMVLRGPSQYDCLLLYENQALEYLQVGIEHWGEAGELAVDYPDPNIGNEHPYYILNVPWSDARQRQAAAEFLRFLKSERIQRRALADGFRPGNLVVPVDDPDSPLVRARKYGLRTDLPPLCQPPPTEVVEALLGTFRRIER